MDLVSLLIYVIVGGLLWYLVSRLPIPEPFKTVAEVIIILILIVVLLGEVSGRHFIRIR